MQLLGPGAESASGPRLVLLVVLLVVAELLREVGPLGGESAWVAGTRGRGVRGGARSGAKSSARSRHPGSLAECKRCAALWVLVVLVLVVLLVLVVSPLGRDA
jgi:hypothetical protein